MAGGLQHGWGPAAWLGACSMASSAARPSSGRICSYSPHTGVLQGLGVGEDDGSESDDEYLEPLPER